MTTTVYKLRIPSRMETTFGVVDAYTLKDVPPPLGFDPLNHKMFNQDIFTFNEGNVDILHSSARCMKVIPGVLVLGNSRHMVGLKINLYKCIPDDKRIPIFLVPYKIKLGLIKI